MTPDEIRAEVTERLARAEYEADREVIPRMLGKADGLPVWEDASEAARQEQRRYVQHLVDALGDLLPTGRSTRTLVYDPDNEPGDTDRLVADIDGHQPDYGDIAERWREEGGRVVHERRWTHNWIEVPDA